jgi:hypothetical protein
METASALAAAQETSPGSENTPALNAIAQQAPEGGRNKIAPSVNPFGQHRLAAHREVKDALAKTLAVAA